MPIWSNGLGEALGDSLALRAQPLWTAGTVWWVDSANGTDAAAPSGKERLQPLATLSQAITNAVAGDVIVLRDGHSETIADLSIAKELTIIGAGQSDGKPTVKLTPGASATAMLSLSAQVELRNVWINAPAAASAVPVIICDGDVRLRGLYMELDENNNFDGAVRINDGGITRIEDSTFVSTATDNTDPPGEAIRPVDGAVPVYLDGVVLDGGTTGFRYGAGYTENAIAAAGVLYAENMSLLRGADMWLTSTTTGLIQVSTSSGGAQIRFGAGIGGPA